jgi:hypothetical protein
MSRPGLLVIFSLCSLASGCGVVAGIAGAPKIVSVTIQVPAGLLVGDSAVAIAIAMGDDGVNHLGRTRHWSSSDPAALPIDANGKMTALIAGRTVTITCEVDGITGTATLVISSDDARFGYALADLPSATGPYVPAAATRFNSGGGTIDVARTSTGAYSVRFAGLGRQPGQRDNVQVSAVNNAPAFCKPGLWTTSGADLIVPVTCFDAGGNPADSRFTVMLAGAWAFGKTAPLGFALYQSESGNFRLDSLATTRNSAGGHADGVRDSEGSYGLQFQGLEPVWVAAPAAVQITGVGSTPVRCRSQAYDKATATLGVRCTRVGGSLGDSPWSVLWLQHGRPAMRFGFAWATNEAATVDYIPFADFLINSSGGTVKSRKTASGQYHVVFAGLTHTAAATETVLVSSLFTTTDRICDILQWGNTGANDLFVDVACYDIAGVPTDSRFGVMVIE